MGASNIRLKGVEMSSIETRANVLEDIRVPVKLKLSALWAALMFLYATIGDDYVYYFFLSFLEAAIALLVVWSAWNWPALESR